MVTKKSWEEFRDSGLFWWINMVLHTFGWAIVCEFDKGVITQVYPARVKFRGFDPDSNDRGYLKVTQYLNENCSELIKECE